MARSPGRGLCGTLGHARARGRRRDRRIRRPAGGLRQPGHRAACKPGVDLLCSPEVPRTRYPDRRTRHTGRRYRPGRPDRLGNRTPPALRVPRRGRRAQPALGAAAGRDSRRAPRDGQLPRPHASAGGATRSARAQPGRRARVTRDIYAGLMSGTSFDGVDAVLADFEGGRPRLLADSHVGFDAAMRRELLALNAPGANEIERAALAGNALAKIYAAAVAEVLARSKTSAAEVRAIGCHGQTVRHRHEIGYTTQIGNPALLAELTGICVA